MTKKEADLKNLLSVFLFNNLDFHNFGLGLRLETEATKRGGVRFFFYGSKSFPKQVLMCY